MSGLQALLLLGIGIAAGGIAYYHYLRKASAKTSLKMAAEELIPVQLPASEKASFEKIKPAESRTAGAKLKTPIKAVCNSCKKAAMLPFRCKFCAKLFCGDHRLPENHECEAL